MQGRLGDQDDDATQKLMVLLSIQILFVALTSFIGLLFVIKRHQWRRIVREVNELDLAQEIDVRVRTIPRMNLKTAQCMYKMTVRRYGEANRVALELGVNLANVLADSDRWLEAERLLTKLADVANPREDFPDNTTLYVEAALKFYQSRMGRVKYLGDDDYEILRYDRSGRGDVCVVKGPVRDLRNRNEDEEETRAVDVDQLLLHKGTPVACLGLEKARAHCNGKLGVVKDYKIPKRESGLIYEIQFEEKNSPPCFVDAKNVRVVFDLP